MENSGLIPNQVPQMAQNTSAMTSVEINRAHWNKVATQYDQPDWAKALIQQVHTFMLSNLSWIGVDFLHPSSEFESSSPDDGENPPIRFLDYACGPGTLTSVLLPYVTSIVGIDLSENMVAVYNERFGSTEPVSGPGPRAQAYTANLLSPSPEEIAQFSGPEFYEFNLAAVGFGYHHFENLPETTARLAERVSPNGGKLMVIDFLSDPTSGDSDHAHSHSHGHHNHHGHSGHGHSEHHQQHHSHYDATSSQPVEATITHPHGFTEEQITQLFTDVGLTDIKFRLFEKPAKFQRKKERKLEDGTMEEYTEDIERTVFVAVGTKKTT